MEIKFLKGCGFKVRKEKKVSIALRVETKTKILK